MAYGVLFSAFAVFVVPMREELSATTRQLSAAPSLAIAVNGIAAVQSASTSTGTVRAG